MRSISLIWLATLLAALFVLSCEADDDGDATLDGGGGGGNNDDDDDDDDDDDEPKLVLVVYKTSSSIAKDWGNATKIEDHLDYEMLTQSELADADLSAYSLIIVIHDTDWSLPSSVKAIEDSGLPVIGVHTGGALLLGSMGKHLNYNHAVAYNSEQSVTGTNCSSDFWNTPNAFEDCDSATYEFYGDPTAQINYDIDLLPSDVRPLALNANYPDRVAMAIEEQRFFLWGFQASPSALTEEGAAFLHNVIVNLVEQ